MARLSTVDSAKLPPEARAAYIQAEERLPQFLNQIGTLAHRPSIMQNMVQLYLGFADDSVVERRLIELAILAVSNVNRCRYCVMHHTPLGFQFGLQPAQVKALEDGTWPSGNLFTERERLVIEYAEQVTRDARRVSDELFERLRAEFSEPEIVELTVRIGLCNFFNHFNDALQLDLEPGVTERYFASVR